jgi:hypothetical protein
MKIVSALAVGLVVSGCSVMGGTYDANEYMMFVNIAQTASIAKQSCSVIEHARINADDLNTMASFAVLYTEGQPHNNEMQQISVELAKLTSEFKVSAKDKMSEGYCKLKLDTINNVAKTAMQAEVSKRK